MKLRRIIYGWALLGSLVFYWAYREWLSWFLLVLIVLLPWFSLLVSLPAILSCRAEVSCPQAVTQDADLPLLWLGRSPYPLPPVTGKLTAENTLNRLRYRLRSGDWLPTEHCGQLSICVRRPRCCDYLGLFVIPIGRTQVTRVLVRPTPIQPEQIPDMRRYQAHMWRPKPGGGFSENHELRLYRPGDSLKQVHWKLSAKTGQLITREPLEPVRSTLLLTLCLQGTPDQLDTKLGQLLWLSNYLLECDLPHSIQCMTGLGMAQFSVACPEDVTRALDRLLECPPCTTAADGFDRAAWRYHIGGDDHG